MNRRAFYPIIVGLLLGTLQTGFYFQLTFTLSSGFGTYLLVTFCWLAGSMIGVLWAARQAVSTRVVLLLALNAYILTSLLLLLQPFNTTLYPLYGTLIVVVGIYPGVFFGRSAPIYRAGVLFFRENNGFVVGLVLGTILFMLLGRPALWFPPLLLAGYLAVVGQPPPPLNTPPLEVEAL